MTAPFSFLERNEFEFGARARQPCHFRTSCRVSYASASQAGRLAGLGGGPIDDRDDDNLNVAGCSFSPDDDRSPRTGTCRIRLIPMY